LLISRVIFIGFTWNQKCTLKNEQGNFRITWNQGDPWDTPILGPFWKSHWLSHFSWKSRSWPYNQNHTLRCPYWEKVSGNISPDWQWQWYLYKRYMITDQVESHWRSPRAGQKSGPPRGTKTSRSTCIWLYPMATH
jgi:hypothetical protein